MKSLYNQHGILLVKGDDIEINNYMSYNGIEYIIESIDTYKHEIEINFKNGDVLIIEK